MGTKVVEPAAAPSMEHQSSADVDALDALCHPARPANDTDPSGRLFALARTLGALAADLHRAGVIRPAGDGEIEENSQKKGTIPTPGASI